MRYFPLFYDSKDKKLLIIGGGAVALQKLEALQLFEFNITLIASKINNEVQKLCKKMGYKIYERDFMVEDLHGFDIVIAATDSRDIHKFIKEQVYKDVLLNTVDSPEFCDFIFGSMVEKNGVLIALSSQGKAPSVVKALKERMSEAVPDNLPKLIDKIAKVRQKMPAGEERMKKIKKLTKKWFNK
ncbi:MAG: hypothetical protein RL154_690 [Pseudomonadota bacterium]|jgi:precorrin-2 dehydrogenase/sirohydrochlorin ferrochelatase